MAFTKEQLNNIWEKGVVVEGYDPKLVRKDACGAWIIKSQYDHIDSDFCWEVDHIYPKKLLEERGFCEKEIDKMENLRPLNRKNNESKGSNYPKYTASVVADGDKNVEKEREFTVNQELQTLLANLYNLN